MHLPHLVSQLVLLGAQSHPMKDSIVSLTCDPSSSSAASFSSSHLPETLKRGSDRTIAASPSSAQAVEVLEATAFSLMYGYPLLALAQLLSSLLVNVPTNTFYHYRALADPEDHSVVRANLDTLYSLLAVDLSHNDLEVVVPSVPAHRFYNFAFYDLYANNFHNIGSTNDSAPGKYLITSTPPTTNSKKAHDPSWTSYEASINYRTTYGIILVRILPFNNSTDLENVWAIQNQISVSPIPPRWQPEPVPPYLSLSLVETDLSSQAAETYSGSLNETASIQLLNLTARLSRYGPPEDISDTARVTEYFTTAGLINGTYHPPPSAGPGAVNFTQVALLVNSSIDAFKTSPNSFTQLGNYWQATAPAVSGDFGTNYAARAYIAWMGYLQLTASVAMYPIYLGPLSALTNPDLLTVSPTSALLLTFSRKPPVNGFWSLTAYGPDNFLIQNSANIYALGDRSPLTYPDGTLVYGSETNTSSSSSSSSSNNNITDLPFQILIQPADVQPPRNWSNNWLPAPPGGGNFSINLRYYSPTDEIENANYVEPTLTAIDAIV